MLSGQFQHNIDIKGRIFIPSKFRDDLKEKFVITKGLDGCIFVYSNEEWSKLEMKIRELPLSTARKLQRFLFAGASEVELDKQGRILISQALREYANLSDEKTATIIGVSNRAEIWNTERWQGECESITEGEIVEIMENLGF